MLASCAQSQAYSMPLGQASALLWSTSTACYRGLLLLCLRFQSRQRLCLSEAAEATSSPADGSAVLQA